MGPYRRQLLLLTTVMRMTEGVPGTCLASSSSDCEEDFFYWKSEVDSTMDEARRLIKDRSSPVAIAAGSQLKGRGTRGRSWTDGDGNVKVTVAAPTASFPLEPITLLPLRIGTIIHGVIAPYVDDATLLKLKWPNDLLLNDRKLSGVLVEMEPPFILIGIGVNLVSAPEVPTEGPDTGRRAIALTDFVKDIKKLPDAKTLARQIADAIVQWIDQGPDTTVIKDWSRLADWTTPLQLRDSKDNYDEDKLLPLRLLDDGRLQVKPLDGKPERALVAEYLL